MKKKLNLSYEGRGAIDEYGVFLYLEEGCKGLEKLIYNSLAEKNKDDYSGHFSISVNVSFPEASGLKVVTE